VWLGGSMNYDELPAYAGQPPRSNGRAVIRSTNADGTAAMYAATHGRGAFTLRLPARPTVAIAGPSELRVGEPVTYGATGNASDGGPLTFAWQLPGNPPTAGHDHQGPRHRQERNPARDHPLR
jgi:hypothetical protein